MDPENYTSYQLTDVWNSRITAHGSGHIPGKQTKDKRDRFLGSSPVCRDMDNLCADTLAKEQIKAR